MEEKKIKKIICVFEENEAPFVYEVRNAEDGDRNAAKIIHSSLRMADKNPEGFDCCVMMSAAGEGNDISFYGKCSNCLALMADTLSDIYVTKESPSESAAIRADFEKVTRSLTRLKMLQKFIGKSSLVGCVEISGIHDFLTKEEPSQK